MKIRTLENLYDALANEIAWRKKELSDFKILVETKGFSPSKHHALLRAGIALLYAHWEGFIRAGANFYLEYVSLKRLPHAELTSNFIAMCLKSEMHGIEQSHKIKDQIKIVDFFFNDITKQSALPYKKAVNAKSNLSSAVLQNIILSLGFNYSFYETKEKLIDEKLVDLRNKIAHGHYLWISEPEYIETYEKMLEIMEYFRNQIDNSAALDAYKRI